MNTTKKWTTTFNAIYNEKRKSCKNTRQNRPMIKDPTAEIFESMQKDVHDGLMKCKPGKEFEVLLQALKPDNQGQQVKRDILGALQRHYPGTFGEDQLHMFGSSVMGIAFKDSDFDFYVELPKNEQSKTKKSNIKTIRNILERTREFKDFLSIKNARVPILKFVHIRTNSHCDLNCSNQYGSLNSPIVSHLLKFDPRIYELAIIIKYWMKVQDCGGTNRISNYAVAWMLIFYLQRLPQRIVPPIDEFQRNVPSYMVNHYYFAFNYSMPNRTQNQSQVLELLLGFFKFYRDFDYESQVICPLFGKAYSKSDILKKQVPELRRCEEILLADRNEGPMQLNKCLCIQDPFEINRTIPGDIPKLVFPKIVQKIGYASEIIEAESIQNGETKSLLLKIFDAAKFDQHVENVLNLEHFSLHLKPNNFTLSMVKDLLLKSATCRDDNAEIDDYAIRKFWAKTVIEAIDEILKDIFKLEIETPAKVEQSATKYQKMYSLNGKRDLFSRREQMNPINGKTWNIELQDFRNRFNFAPEFVELKLFAKVTTDSKNFNSVAINFSDGTKTKKNNFYKAFCTQFSRNIYYLLKSYLIHHQEEVMTSVSADKMSLSVKTPAKSTEKQESISEKFEQSNMIQAKPLLISKIQLRNFESAQNQGENRYLPLIVFFVLVFFLLFAVDLVNHS